MVNFGLLTAEICWRVWGTPANFNGFRVLAALLHATLVVGVNQTLRRWTGRHLYSAGRPSRWALAHILVLLDVLQIINTVAVCPFGALPLLVGWQEGHLACTKLAPVVSKGTVFDVPDPAWSNSGKLSSITEIVNYEFADIDSNDNVTHHLPPTTEDIPTSFKLCRGLRKGTRSTDANFRILSTSLFLFWYTNWLLRGRTANPYANNQTPLPPLFCKRRLCSV